MLYALIFTIALWSHTISAAGKTHVIYTGKPPTGYVVEFHYLPNETTHPSSVIVGGFNFYSDELHASPYFTDGYSPDSWKPYYIAPTLLADYGPGGTSPGVNMIFDASEGDWVATVPFPSGTWQYAFFPDCNTTNWRLCGYALDSSNPAPAAQPIDQFVDNIQVPFDSNFQVRDYDWQLPNADPAKRGSYEFFNYSSPGSTHPAPNIHQAAIYFPPGYTSKSAKRYKSLYLQHGGSGTESDWLNSGRAQNIISNLITSGFVEPFIVIFPNMFNLGGDVNDTYSVLSLDTLWEFSNPVSANLIANLIPWVESHYPVIAKDSSARAFAGLSTGATVAMAMTFNHTSYWSSFGIMSTSPPPAVTDPAWNTATPDLATVGLFIGAGIYDFAYDYTRAFEEGVAANLIKRGGGFLQHFEWTGGHQWITWQTGLYEYVKHGLWKAPPYGIHTR